MDFKLCFWFKTKTAKLHLSFLLGDLSIFISDLKSYLVNAIVTLVNINYTHVYIYPLRYVP